MNYSKHLIDVNKIEDIPEEYRESPIGRLIEYHNLNRPQDVYNNAEILVGMCMDNRKQLHIPDNFAYILRTGGGNLRYSEFKVSYAIAIGKIRHIALIAHNNCGMVNLMARESEFVNSLVNETGWEREWAEQHFTHFSSIFEIGNEIDFVLSEAKRLRLRYKNITVVPLYYVLEESKLYLLDEK